VLLLPTPPSELTNLWIRHFTSSMPRGCNGKTRKNKGKLQRRKNVRGKKRVMKWLLESLQRLKLPSLSLPKISPPRSILVSLLPSCKASSLPPSCMTWSFPPDKFTDDRTATTPSPTLSISSLSDLTSTEFGEDTGEGGEERIPTRHETFYLEDGNVEIVCGHTIFRVHSPIVSFSPTFGTCSPYLSSSMPQCQKGAFGLFSRTVPRILQCY